MNEANENENQSMDLGFLETFISIFLRYDFFLFRNHCKLGMQNYFLKRSLTSSWQEILLAFNLYTTPYKYGIAPVKSFFQSFV